MGVCSWEALHHHDHHDVSLFPPDKNGIAEKDNGHF